MQPFPKPFATASLLAEGMCLRNLTAGEEMLPAPSALGVEVWNLVQQDLVAPTLCFLK